MPTMNRLNLLVGVLVVAAPALAAAQPGGAPPPGAPPPSLYHPRAGTPMFGFSIGLGTLDAENNPSNFVCTTCDYNPIGVEVDGHIGGMLSDRFALMLELQLNGQTVDDSVYGTTTLTQMTAMIAGQYWVTPQLWLKGGVGAAHLSFNTDDYYGSYEEPIDDGAAIMAAVGYEILSARTFALDLQGRLILGSYDGIEDRITAATVGLGFNWYGFGHSRGVIVIH
jgi:hypothetical protein